MCLFKHRLAEYYPCSPTQIFQDESGLPVEAYNRMVADGKKGITTPYPESLLPSGTRFRKRLTFTKETSDHR